MNETVKMARSKIWKNFKQRRGDHKKSVEQENGPDDGVGSNLVPGQVLEMLA
jgi:hypothetical protein